jgi:peptide/nickel transport system permease protein
MYGGRVTLVIAVLGIGFALIAGALLGGLAGYLQASIVDEILMRITDAIMTVPGTIVALVVVAAFGYGKIKIGFLALPPGTIVVFALMFAITPRLFRTMRASIIAQMQEEYVLSAKAMGMSNLRIIFLELLPNSLSPLLIQGMLYLGTAVFMTAALGYLGFGPPDPIPEWGKILSHTQSYFLRRRFWNLLVPGLYIGLIIFAFTILGDGLRNMLDPEFGYEKPSRSSRTISKPNNE